jgi:hypothetical protein
MHEHISKSIAEIEGARAALISEAATMEKRIQDTKQQFIDLPGTWQKAALRERQELVIDHLNPRFLNFKRKIDKETSVIFCAVGTESSSFIHLL